MAGLAEPMRLRSASAQDMDALMAVMAAAFDPRFGEAWTAAQAMTLFALPGTRVMLAEDDGGVTGFSAARLAGPESELLLLGVVPSRRRQGVGAALIADWLAWARAAGAAEAFLEMRADNPALSLYRTAGFAECGRRPQYYRGGDGAVRDAITMCHHIIAK